MQVSLTRMGIGTDRANVPAGTTLDAFLNQRQVQRADEDGNAYGISVNGMGASLSQELEEGDSILLSPKSGGGC